MLERDSAPFPRYSRRLSSRLVASTCVAVAAIITAAGWATPARAAAWCGTAAAADRTPNAVAGDPIQVVYAVPADGVDRARAYAPAIQTDSELIDSWWRGQDPTRTPRFDLFPFSCGNQLDLLDVRLHSPASAFSSPDLGYGRLTSDLASFGLASRYDKYLVYYDGAFAESDICGVGDGYPNSGPDYAFVLLRSGCSDVPTSTIAAHELLHALGALPEPGPPHACPGDPGHPCDSETDILFPYASGAPLSSLVLDFGHDDYYGHSGSWFDIQDSLWLRHLDAQSRLSLTLQGRGSVTSDLPGVECSSSCGTDWDTGTAIELAASPAEGMRFVRWSGACSGSDACDLTVGTATQVTALFAPATFKLSVAVFGRGTISSGSFSCRARCTRSFTSYEGLRLQAKPTRGWRFATWKGACTGRRTACTLPMTADAAVRATFIKR